MKPAGKDYLWGGKRLKTEYDKTFDLEPLAETWECSAHKDGESIAESGIFQGMKLSLILKEHPEYLGTKSFGGELPILVKFIDAEQDLSVQVHPDDLYAEIHEHQRGKTEMWYVLDAYPDAHLFCGFAHDMSRNVFKKDAENGKLMKHLKKIPVHKGDVFYIPAGTIHALGKGILVAEIQENSNVTYRIWDYNRVDRYGKSRDIQLDKALDVLNLKKGTSLRQKPRLVRYYPGWSEELICRCEYFEIVKYQISYEALFEVDNTSFQVLLCIAGHGSISFGDNNRIMFKKGRSIFMPAGLGKCYIKGNTEILRIRC